MIKARIRIGDGTVEDLYGAWGLIYLDADERTEAPIKKRDATSYAEEAGEHTDERTVQDAFDYTVKLLVECPNRFLTSANAKIAAFNAALYEQEAGSDIRRYKEVTFYNDLNRVAITGIPEPISEPKQVYRHSTLGSMDCAVVEWKIRVSDPRKCDFNTGERGHILMESGMSLLLEDGTRLMMETA